MGKQGHDICPDTGYNSLLQVGHRHTVVQDIILDIELLVQELFLETGFKCRNRILDMAYTEHQVIVKFDLVVS